MRLYALVFPLMFMAYGLWSVYVGLRSWDGHGVRPSESVAYSAGKLPRVRRFVDWCVLPLDFLYLCLGITLGLADAGAWHPSAGSVPGTAAGISGIASVGFLVLTVSVYRHGRPRRLVPAYLRHGAEQRRPSGSSKSGA